MSTLKTKKVKKSILLLIWILATCNVYAQTGTSKSGSLLWKISGKGLSKPSYLLGTLHLKSGEYLDSIPGAKMAFQSCEQTVIELDMRNMSELQTQMQQAMMMTPDTTYKMLYSDKDYQFVSEQLTSLIGTGLEELGILKPAAIQLTIVSLVYANYFPDANPEDVLDTRIQSESIKGKKTVLALETANDQMHVLFGVMNLQRQADVLLCYLKNRDAVNALTPELISDYNQGNLDKLYQQQDNEICPSTPSEINALNKDRNDKWMKKLPEIMKEKSSFIAVGALHLAGEEGLLNLLEKAGYKVEPVGM